MVINVWLPVCSKIAFLKKRYCLGKLTVKKLLLHFYSLWKHITVASLDYHQGQHIFQGFFLK
jgi:hypothetical protein